MGTRVDNLIALAKFAILGDDDEQKPATSRAEGHDSEEDASASHPSDSEVTPVPLRPSSSSPDLRLIPVRHLSWTEGVAARPPSLAATAKWRSFDSIVTSLRRNQFRFGCSRQISAPDSFQQTTFGQFVSLTANVRRFAKKSGLVSPRGPSDTTSGAQSGDGGERPHSGKTRHLAYSSDHETTLSRRASTGALSATGSNKLLRRLCASRLERRRGGRCAARRGMESGLQRKCELGRKAFCRVYSMMPRDSIESPNSEEMSPAETTDAHTESATELSPLESGLIFHTSTDEAEEPLWKLHSTSYRKKDDVIRDLKSKLLTISDILKEKDAEISRLVLERGGAVNRLLGNREQTIAQLQQEVRSLKAENRELRSVNLESSNTLHELRMSNNELVTSQMHLSSTMNVLEETIGELKADIVERELKQQELNLRMFRKGQASALFERQVMLELVAKENPQGVHVSELVEKLQDTEKQLLRWQRLCTQESYDSAPRAGSDPEIVLCFVRDAMYHYLTDRSNAKLHMRVMIEVLGYSDKQLEEIFRAYYRREETITKALGCPCMWMNRSKLKEHSD